MANINAESFVKWSVSGGVVAGKVSKIHTKNFMFNGNEVEATDDKQVAEILLPSDQIVVAECSALASMDEVSYKSFVTEFAAKLLKDSGASYMTDNEVKAMKDEMAAMKAKCDAAEAEVASMKAKSEADAAEMDKMKEICAKAQAEADAAKAEIAKFTREKLATARFEAASAANFASIFGDKVEDQKNALANLAESEWALALSLAGKLTQQTVTSQPKLTEQTVTDKTKLTEATAALDNAVVEAAKEADAAAIAANTAPKSLANALSAAFEAKSTRNSKKSSK